MNTVEIEVYACVGVTRMGPGKYMGHYRVNKERLTTSRPDYSNWAFMDTMVEVDESLEFREYACKTDSSGEIVEKVLLKDWDPTATREFVEFTGAMTFGFRSK